MSPVAPIKKKSVVEMALEKIYELIQQEGLQEGDRLPTERELSGMFGISRVSLREAIRVLDMMGIVRVGQGSGMILDTVRLSDSVLRPLGFAFVLNRSRLRELFETRRLIEVECAGLAALNATPEQVEELRAIHRRIAESGADRAKGIAGELELHEAVSRAGGNTILTLILISIRGLLSESRHRTVPPTGVSARTIENDRLLVEAIAARDAERARQIMREHLEDISRRLAENGPENGTEGEGR